MADDRRLAEILIAFARTMVGDFPIQAILDRLVECVVAIVPVTGAGVLLMRADGDRLGALDVYLREPGESAPADIVATQVLADVAASYVHNSRAQNAALRAAEELPARRCTTT